MREPQGRIEEGRAPIKYLALPGQDRSSLQLWLHGKLSLERELRTGIGDDHPWLDFIERILRKARTVTGLRWVSFLGFLSPPITGRGKSAMSQVRIKLIATLDNQRQKAPVRDEPSRCRDVPW